MDHSEQLHFPLEVIGTSQNAAQVIANALALDNPQTCATAPATPKKRLTPRRIPGLSRTNERGYLNDDRELLGGLKKPGSLYAALMLGQLRRDFERDKDGKPAFAQRIHEGHYWVAYSLTYWERQLGLTENEARSGVQCLANSDDVVKVGKFRFGNEPKYLHFRLTEKALGYVPATPVEEGCVATTQGGCANHTATTPTVLAPTVENLNIQNPVAGNATGKPSPEAISEQSGKVKTPKTEQASEPFLKVCLDKKPEFIAANDNGENIPNLIPELTDADRSTAQRLEHELNKAGLDPLGFMDWLTLHRFQHIALIDLNNDASYSLFFIMKHRELFTSKYRQYLDNKKSFAPTSYQQLKLAAIAPQKLKLTLPLYEQDPSTAIGLFSWDKHWLDHQEGGKWGGLTRLDHLRKYSKFKPEMESWLDNEPIMTRVLELMGISRAAAV